MSAPTLSTRQAIILRELVLAYPGYVTASQLGVAAGYPDEAWEQYPGRKSSKAPIVFHRVHAVVTCIRRKFGNDIIEADHDFTRSRPSLGYRLSAKGHEMLGQGWRAA